MNKIYSLTGISVNYPLYTNQGFDKPNPVLALDDLNLDIYENEFIVVLGANGSGKSTLAKLLAGLADKYSGELFYNGELIDQYTREIFNDVALVMQEPQNQILFPTVRDELAFPLENREQEPRAITQKIENIASQFGLSHLLSKATNELSGGQITVLAIASAVITDPRVIILDEPDSHFDKMAKVALESFISNNKHKKTIILISQYANKGLSADRVAILNSGRLAAIGRPDTILTDSKLLAANNLQAQKIRKTPVKGNPWRVSEKLTADQPVIALKNVSYAYKNNHDVLQNISLEVFPFQKIGLAGMSGSGKTTLGLIMAGLLESQRGEVRIKGKPLEQYSVYDLRRLITIAIQFPERALFEETVGIDIAFGPTNMNYDDVGTKVDRQLSQFDIESLKDRHPFTLSGGQKRKAALAGILAMQSEIVILDEPQAGLDPYSVNELIDQINFLANNTLLIISHDYEFLRVTCERIITMESGTIISDMPTSEFI